MDENLHRVGRLETLEAASINAAIQVKGFYKAASEPDCAPFSLTNYAKDVGHTAYRDS